jgi:GT2 family glycosyltransferase
MNTNSSLIDISVCIANYNGGNYVLECITSVYAQQGTFSFEVIVHDDASTDDSARDISTSFPEVKLLSSETNVGFCISNNRMVEAARGRFILLLNNDATLRPRSLEAFFSRASAGYDLDIMGLPQHTLADGTLVDSGYLTDPFLNPIPIFLAGTHEAGVATGACLWIPRQVWDEVGGFPTWLESIAEDIFFCIAARLLGYKVVILEAPGFDHWIGRNLGGGKVVNKRLSTTVRRRALSERNKIYVMLMCYPLSLLAIILPIHAALLFFEATFLILTGSNAKKIKEIYGRLPRALWRHHAEIRELRQRLMRLRRAQWRTVFSQSRWLPHKLTLLLRHGKPELK